ncbi:ER-derived vesicles protein Erv46p [[Candida] anglica]|uniref:Endoplasmic reticulum-Golgi intermediate compartment protein n=1 Tax=[Candida] anglica TaxID=148631 RepID=A0ABP0EK03_9ASCO
MSNSRPKLLSIDAFSKTIEDAKIKTASGGIITLLCVVVVMFLINNEYKDYTRIINLPTLVVDKDINKPLDINLDITFPNLPCELFTMDILDISGDSQVDIINSGFLKYRIVNGNEEILDNEPVLGNDLSLSQLSAGPDKDGKCGSCWGALLQDGNDNVPDNEKKCCNDCQTVKLAYADKLWAFYDGEGIEQCENEGYVKKLQERIEAKEGCRVKGTTKINRISGNLHFAPGASHSGTGRHVHDLSLYDKFKDKFNFDHTINHFSFGPAAINEAGQDEQSHPLDNYKIWGPTKEHVFSYYLKVVATRFEFLTKPSLDTNQFSVITHDRPMKGGRDEDHQHTIHARGGIPGVFFHFDISPMKIINKEQFAKTWSGFVLGVISSVAGVLMVGAVLDRSVWAAEKVIRQKKDL